MRALPFALVALVASVAPARADEIARGSVVRVEADEIYVNLGARNGIAEGARLRIKRPIDVRHPITRAKIKDWLPLGAADVRNAGEQLSMAVVEPGVVAQVKVGDVVEIYVERDDRAPEPETPTEPDAPVDDRPLPAVDPDTVAVLDTWQAQRGAPLPARIAAWEGFLASHGDSPHADAIRDDLETLRQLRDQLAPPPADGTPRAVAGISHQAPTRARAGAPLALVFVLDSPDNVTSAWLHHRPHGGRTYERVLLDREGRTLRGSIPADAIAAPGVEYFVEVVDPRGEPGLAVAPTEVQVDQEGVWDDFASTAGATRVRLSILYLDFATFDDRDADHTDQFTLTEADVEYRVGRETLWAIRAGVGAIHGRGGYADREWQDDAPITGFNYGYAEAEALASRRLALSGRLVAGVGQDGFGLGVEARARLGRPDESNLSIGLSQITEVGFLTDVRFEVDPDGRIPIGLSVGVTDRPAQGDLAVRLGTDIGWRASKRIEPQLRLSYQGRTVQHAGVGAGLGVAFHW